MGNPTLTHLDYCTYCPKMCRHACPVSNADADEPHIPQAKMATLNLARRGHTPWSRENLDPIWACTGCRQCRNYCLHGVEVGPTLFAGRAEANKRGAGHPALDRYPDRFRARDERISTKAREVLPRERFAESADVALWPGCDAVDKGDADVRAQLELLDRLGAGDVRLVDAPSMCGGYPLLAAGHPDEFRWHARRVADELHRYKTVILGCSACVHTLRNIYPAEGIHMAVEVKHTSEWLDAFADSVPSGDERKPVWYHDPCYLARWLDLTEAPRRLLGRVAEVREFAWSHGDTECCGGGGVLPKTMPKVADAMARRRLAEVAEAGGGTVVTSCATCAHMLARNAPPGVVVRDLVAVVEERTRPRSS